MAMTNDDPVERASQEQTRLLMEPIPQSCLVIVATAVLVVAILANPARRWMMYSWLVGVLVVQGLRFRLHRLHKTDANSRNPNTWAESIALNSVLSGSLWGAGGSLLFVTTPVPLQQAFVAILLMGLAAASTTVTVAYLRANLAFIIAATLPLVIACAWLAIENTDTVRATYALMTILLAIYLVFVSLLAKQLNTSLLDSFHRRFQMEKLNHDLEAQRRALHDARRVAEEANDMKTFIMKFASHDTRNYLTNLGITIDRSSLATTDPETASMFRSQLVSTANFVNDIQYLANLMENSLRPKLAAVRLQATLARVHNDLLALAHFRPLSLTWDAPDVWVETDPTMFERVVYNVTLNAIQNTPAGGRVSLTASTVRGNAGESLVRVQIDDTGRGMSPSQLPDLQSAAVLGATSDNRTDDREHLGLRIVAGFSQALGHPARMRSDVGQGTCFELLLPETVAPEAAPQTESGQAYTEGLFLFVVVVEDDPIYLATMQAMIE
jgi:two-component system, sensor histidine kinase